MPASPRSLRDKRRTRRVLRGHTTHAMPSVSNEFRLTGWHVQLRALRYSYGSNVDFTFVVERNSRIRSRNIEGI